MAPLDAGDLMTDRTAPTLLALVLFGAGGCDIEVYPTTSTYDSRTSARASVAMEADHPLQRDDVQEVEVTVDTLALHRPADDRWVLLSGDQARVSLLATPRSATFSDVPVHVQEYDRIAFGIGEVRVAAGGSWHQAQVSVEEVEIEGEFVVEGDVVVQLAFDVGAGLQGTAASGFTFEPLVAADVLSTP